MKFFKNLIQAMQYGAELRARELVRHDFARMSDRQLEDLGISRELLEQGIRAWPWQIDAEPATDIVTRTNLQQAQAIRELMTYSDRELTDIGLSRGGIADAVKYGRPGIESFDGQRAA